jgi:hypothetical protein
MLAPFDDILLVLRAGPDMDLEMELLKRYCVRATLPPLY